MALRKLEKHSRTRGRPGWPGRSSKGRGGRVGVAGSQTTGPGGHAEDSGCTPRETGSGWEVLSRGTTGAGLYFKGSIQDLNSDLPKSKLLRSTTML